MICATLVVCMVAPSTSGEASVGDTGSYVEETAPDGSHTVKAWINDAKSGDHFFTIHVDATGNVMSICTDPCPVPEGILYNPAEVTDEISYWTIELLRRKGHGRLRAKFWSRAPGIQLENEIKLGILPDKCG